MRIAIVASHPGLFLPPRPCDSVARVINSQIMALLELGHKVTLLAPASSQLPSLQACGSLELISICERPVSVEDDLTGSISMEIIRRAKETLYKMKGRVDVVQTHSLDIPGLLFTSNFLNDCTLPHVTTIHSCIELANLHRFKGCTGPFIALSRNQTEACPTLPYIGVIHNGLDPAPFQAYSASIEGVGMNINEDRECKECREIKKGGNSAEQYICFLGRITPEKQPHLALELADYLGFPIKIAGPILDKQYFEEKCKPFLSSSKAEYLGVLEMEAKIKLLSKAVCNLHPTGFRDPCPLVPIEAGMCGTPTIAIKRGALPEIIEDHETGILVEDFTEATFKFEEVLGLDRKRIAEEYRRRFNHIEMAKKYVKVYESLKLPTKFCQHHSLETTKKIHDVKNRMKTKMQEITINTIDDLFPLLRETRLLLYRGLSKASYHLTTTLYRTVAPTIVDISKPEEVKKHSNEIAKACKRTERTILRTFAKYAANIDPHCEDNTPYAVWRQMVLGQHHGLPTRLLDWSQSPMVGLYFATNYSYFGSSASSEEDREEDCLLWQIDPEEIRALLPKEYKEEYEDEEKNDLFFTLKMLEDNKITLDDIDKKGIPIMIEPPSIDQRIINQYSCFTALPAGMVDMEDFLKGTKNSVKYVIPGKLRWEIGKMLDICNIGERILFPGVDGVCMDIARYKKMYTNKPYGKPN